MRRRSPSPVVTGNVSRARMRFESGGSVKSSATPIPLVEPNHQTLPRTFRVNSQQSQPSSNSEKSAINRFLSGSNTSMVGVGTSSGTKMVGGFASGNHQPSFFTPSVVENNFPRARKYESNVESAAKFLTETLPNYSG